MKTEYQDMLRERLAAEQAEWEQLNMPNYIEATIEEYTAWLRGYLAKGGKISHYYSYNYIVRPRFVKALKSFVTGHRCGAESLHILVPEGLEVEVQGHCEAYKMDGFTTTYPERAFVPLYLDVAVMLDAPETELKTDTGAQDPPQEEMEHDRRVKKERITFFLLLVVQVLIVAALKYAGIPWNVIGIGYIILASLGCCIGLCIHFS